MTEPTKKSDEDWKETVEKEKKRLEKENGFIPPEPDFKFFVTTLALQASICLGLVNDPATNQKQENPSQAKFIIDTLSMLKEKTKGNLKDDETTHLENLLYELRLQYVSKVKAEK